MWAASLPMTGGMAHARVRTRLTGALVALVAACAPATADAAIPPAQVEALDRQGATEIVIRREPGLTASERADVRADADVDLVRRSTLPDTEVVRAQPGDLAEAVAELSRDPDVVFAEPVTVQSAQTADPYFGYLWGLENTGQKTLIPGGGGSYYGQGYPRRRHGRPGGVDQGHRRRRVGRDRRHRRPDLAPGPRRADHRQPGRDRHRRAECRQAHQRRRRRRQRLRRRLAGLGLRAREHAARRHRGRRHARPRQPSAGQPRARHARRRHRRGPGRQQRGHRGCRLRRQDHAAARPGRQRARLEHRRRRGVRLRRQDGRADRQRQPRRPRAGPVAARGRPGAPEHAVRDRGRQRQHQRRRHPLRPVCAGGGERAVRRRVRRIRPQGLLLQLRREQRRRLRAGHRDPVDATCRPRTSTSRAPRWRARTRPASPRSCSRPAPA